MGLKRRAKQVSIAMVSFRKELYGLGGFERSENTSCGLLGVGRGEICSDRADRVNIHVPRVWGASVNELVNHGGDSRFLGGGKTGDQWRLGITLSADFQLFSLVEKGIILRRFYDKGKSIGNLRRGNRRKGFIFAAVVT